jgi:hypothetical protein
MSHHLSCVWIMLVIFKHMTRVFSPSSAVIFVTKMSEKRKSTSPSAVRVKNQWKSISTEEN